MSHPEERDLALWAGDDLPAGEAARIESHLAECPGCRSLAEGLRTSRSAVGALAAEPIDEAALARVRAGVRRRLAEDAGGLAGASAHQRAGAPRPAGGRWARAHPTVWALAAALAVAALGLGLWYQAGRPQPADRVARAERPAPPEPDREAVVPSPRESPEVAPTPEGRPERERRSASPSRDAREPAGRPEPAPPPGPPAPPPEPPAAQAELARAPAGPTESMVIKVVSDDPDIVYYWLVEPEETEDEAVTS